MNIFRLKISWVFHWVYSSFLFSRSQSIVVCKYFVFVGNPAFANYFDLKLAKRIYISALRFNKHCSLTLLITDLGWGLHQCKLLNVRQVALSKECFEFHFLRTVINNECPDYRLLPCEECSKIKHSCLVTFIIDDKSGEFNSSRVNINRILD